MLRKLISVVISHEDEMGNKSTPHLTCSESVSNFGDDWLIGSRGGGRCKHKHKVKNEGIAGILVIFNTAWRSHYAIS